MTRTSAEREVVLALSAREPEPKTGLALMRERIRSLEETQIEIAAKTTPEAEAEALEEKPFSAHRLWQLTMQATCARTSRVIDHVARRARCRRNAERRRLEAERALRNAELLAQKRDRAAREAAREERKAKQEQLNQEGNESNVEPESTKA